VQCESFTIAGRGLSADQARFLASRDVPLESKVADGELTEDVVQLFNKIGHSLLQGGLSSIDIVDRTRLFLVATAWFSQEHAGETLSVHEANLIYKQRLTWKLSESELTVVFRSILADTASLLPGWYWLRDFDENDVNELLWNFALDDSAPAVRAGATNLLAKIGKYSNLDSLKSLLNDPITAPNAVELARQAKDSRAIPLLNSLLTDKNSSVSKGAFNAIIEIQIGTDPAEAFERLVAEGRSLPPFLSDIGEDDLLPVDAGTIADALKRAATPIRRFAIDYLIKRELLTRDAAKELLSDPEPSIRKRAVIYLDRLGERFTREEISNLFPEANHQQGGSAGLASFGINSIRASDFLPIILANESNEQLEQQANAFSSSGAIAYGIRAKRDFNQLGPLLREDLAGEFRKLEEAWARSFQARSGAPMTEVWPEDLRDFVRNRYISEAFSVLADNASVGDLDIARKYLQSGNIADSIAAPLISIFRKFGSSRDAENLVEFSRTATEGRAKRLAIDAALLLSDEGTKLASTFLENDDQVVRNSAVRYLKRQEWPKIADVVNEMLLSEHDNIRLVGAALIIKNYDSDQLESLLRSYLGNEVYYYDVVTYVDRAIHSPPQIRDIYRIDITGALN
jgi:HEAT repeat protein